MVKYAIFTFKPDSIRAQNQVRPTHEAISNIVLKSAYNKYLKATLRGRCGIRVFWFCRTSSQPKFQCPVPQGTLG
jgi:hypothetical protein